MGRVVRNISAGVVAYVIILALVYWILTEADGESRRLVYLHSKMRYLQRLAVAFGEAALSTELEYNNVLEESRTV